jgi:hypothetical protein
VTAGEGILLGYALGMAWAGFIFWHRGRRK